MERRRDWITREQDKRAPSGSGVEFVDGPFLTVGIEVADEEEGRMDEGRR